MTDEIEKDRYNGAEFYECGEDSDEGLRHDTPENAIEALLDGMAARDSTVKDLLEDIQKIAPLTVKAYDRVQVDLTKWDEYLADHLIETVEQDEEVSDPEGEFDMFAAVDHKALSEAIGKALAPFSAQVKAWACEEVAKREYSAEEIEALMRKKNPQWFKESEVEHGLES